MSAFEVIVLALCAANLFVTLMTAGSMLKGQLQIYKFMNEHLKADISCMDARIENAKARSAEWTLPT
jgi:hypothetical protein